MQEKVEHKEREREIVCVFSLSPILFSTHNGAFLSLPSSIELREIRQCLGLSWFHLSLFPRR
jgi:hypothetical protein